MGGARRRLLGIAAATALVAAAPVAVAAGAKAPCSTAWTTFGHDATHSFDVSSCSPITPATVSTLVPQWFFPAKDSITASPAVHDGTVYVGSWDGTFYAIDAATGQQKWSFVIRSQARSAFGRIVSSAALERYGNHLVVLFGGGSSMWALDAATGKELATLDLDPRDAATKARDAKAGKVPVAEVESSPAVATIGGVRRIYVGLDVHNGKGVGRTGVVAMTLGERNGRFAFAPLWKYDVETAQTYSGAAGLTVDSGKGWGCGGVWSSPAVDPATNVVTFGSASCDNATEAYDRHENYEEAMHGLDATTGRLLWRFRPADALSDRAARITDSERDADFGASANIFTLGGRTVVGEGRKSADYFVRDLRTGAAVSMTDAGQEGQTGPGFGVGGFLGTPAVGKSASGEPIIVGATAIPVPHGLGDLDQTTWAVRGLDPRTGKVLWTYRLAGPSYGHTSIVNGVALVADTTTSSVIALNIDTGLPLWVGPVIGPPSSTAVVSGSQVFVGTGTRETDLEWKAFNSQLEDLFASTTGASPLSPLSGVQAFTLAAG